MIRRSYFLFFSITLLFSGSVNSFHTHLGMVLLDGYTFDKIVAKFKATLIKFDRSHPFGEKENVFDKVAKASRFSPDLLVAEVGVETYGERINADLAERFAVKESDFPVVKLFVEGKKDPLTFTGDFTEEELKKFIKQHASVRLVLARCLQQFDEIAEKFMQTNDREGKIRVIQEAEKLSDSLKTEAEKKSAAMYLKIMNKIVEKGMKFLEVEMQIAENMQEGNITKTKKTEVKGRMNILKSFRIRDEL